MTLERTSIFSFYAPPPAIQCKILKVTAYSVERDMSKEHFTENSIELFSNTHLGVDYKDK